jgi:hypothetical protein
MINSVAPHRRSVEGSKELLGQPPSPLTFLNSPIAGVTF